MHNRPDPAKAERALRMTRFLSAFLAGTGLALGLAFPAQAAVDEYDVEANDNVSIDLQVCSAETQVAVRGDSGTDLDFVVTDPSGEVLRTDQGIDDYLSFIVENASEGCATFGLSVTNLGEETNRFAILLEPVVENSTRVEKAIIQPGSSETVRFKACGTSASVLARGDGDTDLDFIIRNADGGIVHEDDGATDGTSAELTGLLSDCEIFEMEVANLGDVYNALMVVVEPRGAADTPYRGEKPSSSLAARAIAQTESGRPTLTARTNGAGEYRAAANTRLLLDLPICGATHLEVRGTGASDLDFSVSNTLGEVIHEDVDMSDVTFASLEPAGSCETFVLSVDNLGDVSNPFTVGLIDQALRTSPQGPGRYRINSNSATKVPLRVCAPTRVSARGGGESDLDFDVVDALGQTVHSDYDLTDATRFDLDPKQGCEDFQIKVGNLGDAASVLTVVFNDEGGGSQALVGGKAGIDGAALIAGKAVNNAASARADRGLLILNHTGDTISDLFWSNSATLDWGEDRLSEGDDLASDQEWGVEISDASQACLFDFRAVTKSGRVVEIAQVNVCKMSRLPIE
jgi:hypothetical protein